MYVCTYEMYEIYMYAKNHVKKNLLKGLKAPSRIDLYKVLLNHTEQTIQNVFISNCLIFLINNLLYSFACRIF